MSYTMTITVPSTTNDIFQYPAPISWEFSET